MKPLSDVFADEELNAAQRILDAVPNEDENIPMERFTIQGIVLRAYINEVVNNIPERGLKLKEQMISYCERHEILEKLVEAGFICSQSEGDARLYFKDGSCQKL